MRLWLMIEMELDFGSVMCDRKLVSAGSLCGSSTVALRNVLFAQNVGMIEMGLARPGETTTLSARQLIPDFLRWVSTPIFSDRAAGLAIEHGCAREEFWPCRFESNPDERYFFHLPTGAVDIVDYDRSIFRMTLPGTPPIPMFAEMVKTKRLPTPGVPCFRALIPGSEQVLVELFVRDDFKEEWERNSFRGAEFCGLST
jgi:hypothetical protein